MLKTARSTNLEDEIGLISSEVYSAAKHTRLYWLSTVVQMRLNIVVRVRQYRTH